MKEARNELLLFLAGLAMLITGLLIFSQKVMVSSGFSRGFMIGNMQITSGLVVVPLIMGVVWLFASGGSFGAKVLTALGVFIIVVAVISSTTIHLVTMTLYDWILILVLIFGGVGLIARVLFADHDDDYGYKSRKNKRKNIKDIEDKLNK